MNHALLAFAAKHAGDNFHKSAKILNANHFAGVGFAHLWLSDDGFNDGFGFQACLALHAGNGNHALIVNINLGAGFFHNLFDNFAAAANNLTDFVGMNLHRNNPGSVGGNVRSGFGNAIQHFAQDESAALLGLSQGAG